NVRISFADKDGDGYIEPFNVNPNEPNNGTGGEGATWNLTDTEILQESHYYPFGMAMDGAWQDIVNGPENKYLYNGKELNRDFGLDWSDYGARYYDAAIGRWNSVDPLAELNSGWSGYRYGFNNPIRFSDPTGMIEKDESMYSEAMDLLDATLNYNYAKENGQTTDTEAEDLAFAQMRYKGSKSEGKEKGKKQDELPTPEELSQRFGDSFKDLFLDDFMLTFEGALPNKTGSVSIVADHIENFDFLQLIDKEGNLNITIYRLYVNGFKTGTRNSVFYTEVRDVGDPRTHIPWGERGMTINPGVYHPKWSGGNSNIYTAPIEISTSDGGIISVQIYLQVVPVQ
ncbi:MAG: RHS repeat-associated core domain-containing protein, partial [Saprospiraceae bacterium]